MASSAAGWRAMTARGFADLSPPEAQHALLELPTNRAEYIGVLQDMGDYPARSPIGVRVPDVAEIAALRRTGGRWRAVVLLEDERALRVAAGLFSRVFVLDPFYDPGAMLYAAWHDPLIRDEHSRRLAEQAGMLVRAAPLLNAGTAVLTPDHLPGSWNPRPGWRKPRPSADRKQLAAWSLRQSLVLLAWADRLDGLVCATGSDVIVGLELATGPGLEAGPVRLVEAADIAAAQEARAEAQAELSGRWDAARALSRRRGRRRLVELADALHDASVALGLAGRPHAWRVSLGETSLPEPAALIRRVLNGQDPERLPALPRIRLRRRPVWLGPRTGPTSELD
jgi:hypothetical protein